MANSSSISVETIEYHTHYNSTGIREEHQVGDVYDVTDLSIVGMTAAQLVESLEAMKMVKRIESKKDSAKKANDDKTSADKKSDADAPSPTAVEAMKFEADHKTVERRTQDVKTVKK